MSVEGRPANRPKEDRKGKVGSASIDRAPTFKYLTPKPDDKIILFTPKKARRLFSEEEMNDIKPKMEKNVSRAYTKQGQLRLDKKVLEEENDKFKDLNLKIVKENFEDGYYYGQYNAATKEREGKGVCVFKNFTLYEGFWKDDNPNGTGRLINSAGTIYVGGFENGQYHGEGTLIHQEDKSRHSYKGKWKEGIMHGEGHEQFTDGS